VNMNAHHAVRDRLTRLDHFASADSVSLRRVIARSGAALAIWTLSLVLCVVAIGCGGSPEAQAAYTLDCDSKSVQTTQEDRVRFITGCGRSDAIAPDSGKDAWISLRERAGFDLTCEMRALEVTDLGAGTYSAKGCGKQATYKFVPSSGFVKDAKEHLAPPNEDPSAKPPVSDSPPPAPQ
jgi:hypothetical protein